MNLTSIKLRNFRVHADLEMEFTNSLNYIVGGNGQGKTTILESIYYLCTTKSFNARTDAEVVSFGKEGFEITGHFRDITEDSVRIICNLNDLKKSYFLNDKNLNRYSNIIGKFPIVLLAPSDHSITQGAPGERRKFIDSVISQASSTYLKSLIDYNRTLKHRSSLLNRLKDFRTKEMIIELDAWTAKLVETGSEIILWRKTFINEFNSFVRESYYRIMEQEKPLIDYYHLDGYNGDEVKNYFEQMIDEKRNEEFKRATNLVGPHRDDFIFSINNSNLKTYGSQGQHKTFQTALRFAEFFYLKEITTKTPIFLLDDVFGELDAMRAQRISEYLKDIGQAFVTITDFGNIAYLKNDEDDTLINLNEGNVVYA
jgi:DNA replication and repair protein RecF